MAECVADHSLTSGGPHTTAGTMPQLLAMLTLSVIMPSTGSYLKNVVLPHVIPTIPSRKQPAASRTLVRPVLFLLVFVDIVVINKRVLRPMQVTCLSTVDGGRLISVCKGTGWLAFVSSLHRQMPILVEYLWVCQPFSAFEPAFGCAKQELQSEPHGGPWAISMPNPYKRFRHTLHKWS
jgi:hypothetical protein